MTIDTQKLREYAAIDSFDSDDVNNLLDHIDAQAAEIERLKKALRVAVLALAHATEEHGKVYEPAYDAVQIALYGDPDAS